MAIEWSYVINSAVIFGVGLVTGLFSRKLFMGSSKSSLISNVSKTARYAAIRTANPGRPHKMVLVVRQDLGMNKGKIAAQCAHAAVICYKNAINQDPTNLEIWEATGCAKICLKLNPDEDGTLQSLQKQAKELSIVTGLVCDAGHTQVAPGTYTVLGIGPAPIEEINKITGKLKLL